MKKPDIENKTHAAATLVIHTRELQSVPNCRRSKDQPSIHHTPCAYACMTPHTYFYKSLTEPEFVCLQGLEVWGSFPPVLLASVFAMLTEERACVFLITVAHFSYSQMRRF